METPQPTTRSLSDTLEQYLHILAELLGDAELERTRRVVKEFSAEEGPELQAQLERIAASGKKS